MTKMIPRQSITQNLTELCETSKSTDFTAKYYQSKDSVKIPSRHKTLQLDEDFDYLNVIESEQKTPANFNSP